MVKAKTAKKSTQAGKKKSKSTPRLQGLFKKPSFVITLVIIVLFGLFALNWAINAYQANQEKNELLAKQAELETIADKIATYDKPDSREKSESCDYANVKYEKGQLSCEVTITMVYKSVEVESLKDIIGQQINLIDSIKYYSNDDIFSQSKFDNETKEFNFKLKQDQCIGVYKFDVGLKSNKDLIIYLSCVQSPAKAPHFPLQD